MLPVNGHRTTSYATTEGSATSLGRGLQKELTNHAAQSGVLLLGNGLDAFVGRAALARQAERTIDVQYYMFHQDTVGRLLIRELLAAADRGVRVRMLIDDMYGGDGDDVWSALDSHPKFEVRLFNPFVRGRSKDLQFITRVRTVNHRMHSKSFTVDNEVSIVGGRNIGDEYFDADPSVAFSDLDAMAIGPVVPEVSGAFDQYWNSAPAFPVGTLMAAAPAGALDKLRGDLAGALSQPAALAYIDALENSTFAGKLREHSASFGFSDAKIIHDSPEKLERAAGWRDQLLISQLVPYIEQATREFILVSPYFVPGKHGADALCGLSQKGVRVRVLTNSLVSNDVAAVHTAYMRHRKQLLSAGVELYELNEQLHKLQSKRFTWLPGLSKSSLHAKTMAIDGTVMFVGSFNFDQRSLYLNNEIGIVFREPELASRAARSFDENVDKVAFRVELLRSKSGRESLRWTGMEEGQKVVFHSEPYAGRWKRLSVNLMRALPIDSMM
jgi:cardiolipin synthase C